MLLAIILIPLALYLEPGAIGRALMIASVLLVLIVELLNSIGNLEIGLRRPSP